MIKTKNARLLPSGFAIALAQEIGSPISRLIFRLFGGYDVKNGINGDLGHRKRYIIAANHQSMFDPFAIFALLTFRHRWHLFPAKFMTIPKIYHKPYIKPFAYLFGCFPAHIRERNHHTYGTEGTIKLLHYGYNICIFPEGTRTLKSESDPKPGISRVMEAYPDAKLLLAHIEWQKGPWYKRHVTVTVAHAPEALDKNDPKAIMDAIYAL
jgi:1-acyl-sn-glycerol-3-phosphate acyltransferase